MIIEDALKALIIFNKNSEVLYINHVVSKNYKIDPIQIVNFLKAALKFAKNIGESDAKTVDIEKLRLNFIEKKDIIFTLITTKIINPIDTLSKLNTIVTLFLTQFTEEILNNIKKYQKEFSDFKIIIQEIIEGELTALENGKKLEIKNLLTQFNEIKPILGSAVLSFSGKVLINAFKNHESSFINTIFNSICEMRLSGIMKVFIEFQNLNFFSNKINDETVLITMSEKGLPLADLEKYVEDIKSKIKIVINE